MGINSEAYNYIRKCVGESNDQHYISEQIIHLQTLINQFANNTNVFNIVDKITFVEDYLNYLLFVLFINPNNIGYLDELLKQIRDF